jgi:uncharacterized protein YycO
MQLDDLARDLQIGDIVFIRVANFLYRRVAEATNSWTSHVGMIHSERNGVWQVAESTVPFSKLTRLDKFIKRTESHKLSVKRLVDQLTADDRKKLQSAAEKRLGKLYHLGFNHDSEKMYCSKFVYEVYKEALGVEIGEIETFKALISKRPDLSQTFWKIWFFGNIPWQRRTLSPGSQYSSDLLTTVYENLSGSPIKG